MDTDSFQERKRGKLLLHEASLLGLKSEKGESYYKGGGHSGHGGAPIYIYIYVCVCVYTYAAY